MTSKLFPENENGIVAAEAEAVAEGDVHPALPGQVGDDIEVAIGIGLFLVDRRRNDILEHCKHRYCSLERARRSEAMADSSFDRRHRNR